MILVTGATGTIGTSAVDALKKSGAKFKVGVRNVEKARGLGVETVAFDWDNAATYDSAFKGVEKIFLLQPLSERQHGYTILTVAAAKRAGVKQLVRISVNGAEMEPGIILGRQHNACDKELKYSGIPYTLVRPTFFMQNFVNYYGVNPKQDAQVYLPHGQSKTSWLDARDIGEVAAAVLTKPGHEDKAYDLSGPEALSTPEALAILGQALGHKYTYVDVPESAAREAMSGMGMPNWNVDGMMELNAVIKAGYAAGISDGVKQVLGRPARSFKEWAKDLAATVR